MAINKQLAAGFLSKDAKITSVGESRFSVSFRIGVTERILEKGKRVGHTEWFNVQTYIPGNAEDFFRDRLKQGALVYVEGRHRTRTFTGDGGDEIEHRAIHCEFHEIEFLRPPPAKEDTPEGEARSSSTASGPSTAPSAPAELNRDDLCRFE